jgi:lipoyl(octanoyl) transferase
VDALTACDHFPLLTADGPTQMAADEMLLEHAIASGRPGLRFYTWDPPTLSLGYFQAYADRLAGLPVVRRQTGGGAIVHHHELTYAVAVPSCAMPAALGGHVVEQPMPAQSCGHGTQLVCRMHEIIRTALDSLGVAAASACGQETGRGAFLCFEHHTPGDVLLGDSKIVGSAQRRRAGALLQHGSILLAASPFVPRRRGIRDLTNVLIAPDRLAVGLADTFSQMTGWLLVPSDWSNDMSVRREQIAAERYCHPAWTERR